MSRARGKAQEPQINIEDEINKLNRSFDKINENIRAKDELDENDRQQYMMYKKQLSDLTKQLRAGAFRKGAPYEKSFSDRIVELEKKLESKFGVTRHVHVDDDPRIAEIVEKATQVLRAWDDVKPVKYDQLLQGDKDKLELILQAHLPRELADVILQRYMTLPPDVRPKFVENDVAIEIGQVLQYARRLLAEYYGLNERGELDIPAVGEMTQENIQELQFALRGVFAHALTIRPFYDSMSVGVQAAAVSPVNTGVTAVTTTFAVQVARSLTPIGDALLTAATTGVGADMTGLITAIASFIAQNPVSTFASVYYTWANRDKIINKLLSLLSIPPQMHGRGDIQALINHLNDTFQRQQQTALIGDAPSSVTNFWDAIKYILWYFKYSCASQAELAASGMRDVAALPQRALAMCKRFGTSVSSVFSKAATSVELGVMKGTVADETFITFHEALKQLLQTTFSELQANPSVDKHMRLLAMSDPRKYLLLEQRVELHKAIDAKQDPWMYVGTSDTQEAVAGSLSPERHDQLEEGEVMTEGQEITDEHGALLQTREVAGQGQPSGQGSSLAGFISGVKSGDLRSNKGGSTRHKRAATKKYKSKKNKQRQSRRKVRRASSRKGRK